MQGWKAAFVPSTLKLREGRDSFWVKENYNKLKKALHVGRLFKFIAL